MSRHLIVHLARLSIDINSFLVSLSGRPQRQAHTMSITHCHLGSIVDIANVSACFSSVLEGIKNAALKLKLTELSSNYSGLRELRQRLSTFGAGGFCCTCRNLPAAAPPKIYALLGSLNQ